MLAPETELTGMRTSEKETSGQFSSVASAEHPNRNEDSYIFDAASNLYGVFDGLGGHDQGDQAANLVSLYIGDTIKKLPSDYPIEDQTTIFQDIFLEAAEEVKKQVPGAGTTALILRIIPNNNGYSGLICSIGDSRAYLFRNNTLLRLTQDDSLVSEYYPDPIDASRVSSKLAQVKDKKDFKKLSALEKKMFDNRNVLTQYLGEEGPIRPQIQTLPLRPGDKLLLLTDGVSDNLTETEITDILRHHQSTPQNELISQAVQQSAANTIRSKPDDMTAIIVEIL